MTLLADGGLFLLRSLVKQKQAGGAHKVNPCRAKGASYFQEHLRQHTSYIHSVVIPNHFLKTRSIVCLWRLHSFMLTIIGMCRRSNVFSCFAARVSKDWLALGQICACNLWPLVECQIVAAMWCASMWPVCLFQIVTRNQSTVFMSSERSDTPKILQDRAGQKYKVALFAIDPHSAESAA